MPTVRHSFQRYDLLKPPTRVYPAWMHGDIDDGTTKRETEYEPMDEIEFVRELNRGRRKKP